MLKHLFYSPTVLLNDSFWVCCSITTFYTSHAMHIPWGLFWATPSISHDMETKWAAKQSRCEVNLFQSWKAFSQDDVTPQRAHSLSLYSQDFFLDIPPDGRFANNKLHTFQCFTTGCGNEFTPVVTEHPILIGTEWNKVIYFAWDLREKQDSFLQTKIQPQNSHSLQGCTKSPNWIRPKAPLTLHPVSHSCIFNKQLNIWKGLFPPLCSTTRCAILFMQSIWGLTEFSLFPYWKKKKQFPKAQKSFLSTIHLINW